MKTDLQVKEEASNFIFISKEDAQKVLDALNEIIDGFGFTSLEDFYDLIGRPSSYTDNKWKWTDLTNVDIHQTENGYSINFSLSRMEAI